MIYKLHPSEYADWKTRYPWLRESSVEVIDDPRRSIYELFAGTDAQVGVYSTALFEGLAFGLPTFIAKIPGWADMEILIQRNLATLVSNADELVNCLNGELHSPSQDNLDAIWQPNPKENFVKFIEQFFV